MSLQEFVTINTHYTRSINLERDAGSLDVVHAYIPTSRALRIFQSISKTFHNNQAPRAWSLIGPYGSGKSSFSVFLSQLLSNTEDQTTIAAREILNKADAALSHQYTRHIADSNGYLKVLITGTPESISKRLVKGLAEAAKRFWGKSKGKKPKIIAKLDEALKSNGLSTPEIIKLIDELQTQVAKRNGKGLLLIIDELGKFLEYEARHYGANDIYLLQVLAEHACCGKQANLYLFVLLHQSFEQYAKGLGENLKNEWSKVQGRFEEVPFLESAEQVLRIVSTAFKHSFHAEKTNAIKVNTEKYISVMEEQNALPGALTYKEARKLFEGCYPLHPVSALLLPLLCQKVAQNERTLFNYLGSHEEHGLQDMMAKLESVQDYIYPHHIYDYFIANQPVALGDYSTHRRWAEVVTAIERLGDARKEDIDLLKTIGILNIIGSKGGFKSSKSILEICIPNKTGFAESISVLKEKSIVNYRQFNNEYRVWQGSDFDLEEALQEEFNNLGNFSLATELNKDKNIPPVVARKYTIQNGALRYFMPVFVDAQTYKTTEKQSNEARIIFYLASAQDDEKIFHEEVIKYFSQLDITVLCLNGSQLREAVAETLALKRIQTTRHELNTDPIAKREFQDRLAAAEHSEDFLLYSLIDNPQENKWFHQIEKLEVNNKRALQVLLSDVLRKVYCKSPKIFNELINRNKPSVQANAARNKLLQAMLHNEATTDLAIEKFPPEKAIYRAVLRELKLHQINDETANNRWGFTAPPEDGQQDKANIRHVWQCINQFLDSSEKVPLTFATLSAELMAPPYGVKAGVLPILYITAYFVYRHELALYENRSYKPFFTEEMLERFIKRPDEFTFQRFRIEGLRASIFKQYSQVIHGDTKQRTLLELAKPLAAFMGGLPEYTHKTRRGLSAHALAVRSAFNLAKSPERLLFAELPKALGFENLDEKSDESELEQFAQALTETLRELRDAYAALKKKQKKLLAQAFNIDANLLLSELRKVIAGNCYGLDSYTVDTQGLRAFIMRLIKTNGSDEDWLENILMFLGHKPSKKWLDSDQDKAEYRLSDFSRRVIDLEKLRLHEKGQNLKISGNFDVYLLRSVRKGGDFLDEVVAVDRQSSKHILETKITIENALSDLPDKELKLAALAEVVDKFLNEYRGSQKQVDSEVAEQIKKPRLTTGG